MTKKLLVTSSNVIKVFPAIKMGERKDIIQIVKLTNIFKDYKCHECHLSKNITLFEKRASTHFILTNIFRVHQIKS